ncbi:acetyl-coenzyme A synthetase N-terminal domain-containing protein, partial [Arthrobacter mobilis]
MPAQDTPLSAPALENLLHENRRFAPDPEFAANAVARPGVYEEAAADRPAFWTRQARELLSWEKDFGQALDWTQAPFAKWFVGGELNA